MTRIAIFPGSFDPFTRGHEAVVAEALRIFDKVVIAIGYNTTKRGMLSVEARKALIDRVYKENPRVEVTTYTSLTADEAKRVGATAMIRSLRNSIDFEYERSIADVNRMLTGIDTLLLISEPQYAAISSSMVRELARFGKDIAPYLP